MASAKFLEEALSTDVDETAVSALVGSLQNQLVTSSSTASTLSSSSYVSVNQNNVKKRAITNGATVVTQKHISNGTGDGMNIVLQGSADLSQKNITQGVVTVGKPTNQVISGPVHPAMVGNPSTMLPTGGNVQLINVNALRQGAPQQQPGQRVQAPRLIIPQQLVGGRPTQNLTLQTLQGLQGVQGGHLLLKTENGQFQLLKVGPPPPGTTTSGTTTIPANNAAFRLQTIPGQGTVTNNVPPLTPTSVSSGPQTMVSQQVQQQQAQQQQQAPQQTSTQPQQPQQAPARAAQDTVKEKCRKFLSNLLELSSREPKAVEKNVRTLIQELVDAKVEPEQFCERLEKLLNASPQPCLIGFLNKSLPLLRQSMVTKELSIDGIRPPPANLVFSQQQPPTIQQQQPPPQQMQPQQTTIIRHAVPGTNIQQQPMRIISQGSPNISQGVPNSTGIISQGVPNNTVPVQVRQITPGVVQSPQHPQVAQQRVVTTPVRGKAAQQQAQVPSPRASVRPPRNHLIKNAPGQVNNKATASTVQNLHTRLTGPKGTKAQAAAAAAAQAAANQASPQSPSLAGASPTIPPSKARASAAQKSHLASSNSNNSVSSIGLTNSSIASLSSTPAISRTFTSKESKSKSFSTSSSSSFVGDDDINDVAAMGGVNLAEESQRILGSTEMIGTQIRSCKDEIFLHSQPLLAKISLIAAQYNLEEPSADILSIVSHAAQSRLTSLTEKLSICAEHRVDQQYKALPGYSLQADARGQLKFLESLDRIEARRREEQEREMLLRAAKSRSKSEDPEQVKLKAKAKEMQRAEMEELRQKAADLTALQAIGPRKKPKLDNADGPSQTSNGLSSSSSSSSSSNILSSRPQLPLKPRVKRITMKDCIFLLEREKEYCKSDILYKAYLK